MHNCRIAPPTKRERWNKARSRQVFSSAARRVSRRCERNMLENIRSKSAKLLREFLTGILAARRSFHAAVALGIAASASLSPGTAHAQEYPWCVSRESYLDCAYTTHEQCQQTASGIGGCALNPRLLFSKTPRVADERSNRRRKTHWFR